MMKKDANHEFLPLPEVAGELFMTPEAMKKAGRRGAFPRGMILRITGQNYVVVNRIYETFLRSASIGSNGKLTAEERENGRQPPETRTKKAVTRAGGAWRRRRSAS